MTVPPESPAVLRVRLLRPDAVAPRRMSPGASGLDLSACLDEPIVLQPGARALVATGIAIALPEGTEGQVRPRSGLANGSGVTVLNAPGTVDVDYRGEVKVILINHGAGPFTVRGEGVRRIRFHGRPMSLEPQRGRTRPGPPVGSSGGEAAQQ